MKHAQKNNYRYSICFDFPDDLIYTPFTRDSLEKLFKLYQSWGVTRIYWIYTWKHRERLWEGTLSASLSRNYEITRRALRSEFLPAAVRLAHALGMEFYAVYKPFDLAFNQSHPFGTSAARRAGRLDALSGRIHWAAECLAQNRLLRIRRRQDDIPADLDRRRIGAIVLRSDRAGAPANWRGRLEILVSRDNNLYRRYRGPLTFRESAGRNGRELALTGLRIREPYLALRVQGARSEKFSNTLAGLVEVYDDQGEKLPFTYGLYARADFYASLRKRLGATGRKLRDDLVSRGYLFGWHPLGGTGYLRTARYALDNAKGEIALARGKEEYVIGALSPAYPAVRRLFLKHVRECLDAGVDGVDLRVGNHNRSLEWENYGFEQPVLDECRRRGIDPYGGAADQRRRLAILGESYTQFVRDAAQLIRQRGKRIHIHVSQDEVLGGRLPVPFEWQQWVHDKLADEITLMTDTPARYDRLTRAAAAPRGIPRHFRKYVASITYRPRWQRMFRDYLRQSRKLGHAGFIIYESSFVVHGQPDGSFTVLYPDIPRIMREVQAEKLNPQDAARS